MGHHHHRGRRDRRRDLCRAVHRRATRGSGPQACGAGRRRRCRRARRLARRQRGDRWSRLVWYPARAPGAMAAGRGGRLPRLVAGAAPDPGGGPRPVRAGHGQPPAAPALVPGGRGGLPALPGPRGCRGIRPARGPGRHCHRPGCAAGRTQARPRHRPPRRPVVQRVRPHRPDHGPDPRRPHGIPAAARHAIRRADRRTPARADPHGRRADPVRPAPRVHVHAGQNPPGTTSRHRTRAADAARVLDAT